MKDLSISIAGQTDSKGNLKIWNNSDFKSFLASHPNSNFQMIIQVQPKKTSEALLAYYRNYILPEFQRAWKNLGENLSFDSVEEQLKELTVSMKATRYEELEKDDTGFYIKVDGAGNQRLTAYIDELRMLGALEFSIDIQDPQQI